MDINSYFATIEQQVNPHLRGKPIVVVAVMTDSTCAIAASYNAKLKGIKTGTPIYQAKKLCPELICVLARHEVYVDYHHRILEEVDKHIFVDHVLSIDECACRLTGEFKDEKCATGLADEIKKGIKENVGEYITCSIGISTNRFLAKIATKMQKPDGLVVIKQEDISSKLYGLKLRNIPGIGASTYNRLTNAGISTVKDLYNLDIVELRRVWGSSLGERCWYGLRGIELADSLTKNQSIGNSQVLAPKLRSQSKAKEVAYRLLQKAASRMRREEFQATRQILAIELESGEVYKHAIKFSHCADSFNLLSMLTKSWDALMGKLRLPKIKKISITLAGLIKNTNIQPELFAETQGRKDTTRLLTAIDLLNKKFGRDTVSIGVLPDANKDMATTKIAFSRIPDMDEFFE